MKLSLAYSSCLFGFVVASLCACSNDVAIGGDGANGSAVTGSDASSGSDDGGAPGVGSPVSLEAGDGGCTTPPARPTASPAPGQYCASQFVVLTDTTPNATIYFTLDGTTPTPASQTFVNPIAIDKTTTITAIAVGPCSAPSAPSVFAYTIDAACDGGVVSAPPPDFTPAPGAFTATQYVSLSSSTPGATIYYTTDGTAPGPGSNVYVNPIAVAKTTTIHAIAIAPGLAPSTIATGTFVIQ
jgi:hypothetical protein